MVFSRWEVERGENPSSLMRVNAIALFFMFKFLDDCSA
jgi:hypothetical protein